MSSAETPEYDPWTTDPPLRPPTGNHRPKVSKRQLTDIRLAVYERDGYACVNCGWQPEIPERYSGDGALCGPAPESELRKPGRHPSQRLARTRVLELDHKIPYSKGGRFTVKNLQAMCSTCNYQKGASLWPAATGASSPPSGTTRTSVLCR
jgi:5-methylcytosine-specific restriction endonuclease McrA